MVYNAQKQSITRTELACLEFSLQRKKKKKNFSVGKHWVIMTATTQLATDLIVEQQHRCSYTGGKSVYSHLDQKWIACLNNEEITFLSTKSGEIIFNVNASGQCIQTLSPLNKTIRNQQEMDSIITFDISNSN